MECLTVSKDLLERFAPATATGGFSVLGTEMPFGEGAPEIGDLVSVRSSMDPSVEFSLRLTANTGNATWKAIVFGIDRDGTLLEKFGDVVLDDEVQISLSQICSLLKCGPAQ